MHTKIVIIATETIPGCDLASITMLREINARATGTNPTPDTGIVHCSRRGIP